MHSRVVIIGGGIGGVSATKALRRAPVDVTRIDRTNHFLFLVLLAGFRNRVGVVLEWGYAYLTYRLGARLITHPERTRAARRS